MAKLLRKRFIFKIKIFCFDDLFLYFYLSLTKRSENERACVILVHERNVNGQYDTKK